jgi:hypothetical protein
MKRTFEIKITGSGTPKQLVDQLRNVAKRIESLAEFDEKHGAAMLDGAEWEDAILVTEINAE